jgi:hypothetical protein
MAKFTTGLQSAHRLAYQDLQITKVDADDKIMESSGAPVRHGAVLVLPLKCADGLFTEDNRPSKKKSSAHNRVQPDLWVERQ